MKISIPPMINTKHIFSNPMFQGFLPFLTSSYLQTGTELVLLKLRINQGDGLAQRGSLRKKENFHIKRLRAIFQLNFYSQWRKKSLLNFEGTQNIKMRWKLKLNYQQKERKTMRNSHKSFFNFWRLSRKVRSSKRNFVIWIEETALIPIIWWTMRISILISFWWFLSEELPFI